MKNNSVTIGDVFKVSSGATPSRKKAEYFKNGTIPWVKTGNLKEKYVNGDIEYITSLGLEKSSAKLFPPKTVLVAMYGATIGACSILKVEASTNQACAALLPNSKCNEHYLYYFLLSIKPSLILKGVGGAQPNISATLLKRTKIPLPPLPVQQKIATILDTAGALKQKNKALIAKYDELSQSLFLDMFGDPVTNPKGWSYSKFDDCVLDIIGGKSVGGEERPILKGEMAVLKISSVTSGHFKADKYKVVKKYKIPLVCVKPEKNDLLFSRANTREMVGAVCIVNANYSNLFLPDKLWKIILEPETLSSWYVKFLLSHDGFRENLRKVATGTSGSMLNISKSKLKNLKIPVPPINLQSQFSARIQAIEQQKQQAQASLQKSEDLFNCLLQKAFKGELV